MRRFGGLVSLALLMACGSYKNPGGGGGGDGPDAGPGGGPDAGGDTPSEVVECPDPIAPPAEGACDVTPGSGTAVFLRGTVLGRGTIYENGGVLYDGTQIQCVGCDCGASDAAASATRVDCAGAVISPGLINPHDHITFTEGKPVDHGTTRYDHRHEWRGTLPAPQNPHGGDGTRWGEIRMMLGGVTSIVGSGGADGLVRNLDRVDDADEALGFESVRFETFSLGDGNETFHDNCDWNYKLSELEASEEHAFLPHVAEGIDEYAAEEFRCQSSSFDGGHDFTEHNATHIHSIGLGAAEYMAMARDRTRLIWSPRSNISLYGHTAMVTAFDRMGGNVALGTDWTYSGSANMLRELACADEYNRDNLGGYFTDEALWKMATWNAALATGSEALIGSLEAEKVADIAVFAAGAGVYHRAVIDAQNEDVLLVVSAGRALYGESDVIGGLEDGGCESIDVCGAAREICLQQAVGTTYAALADEVSGAYPAMFCGGAPIDEPTCVPSRPGEFTGVPSASDPDGDGLEGGADNCASVFNPLRPIDNGAQPDADGDGSGDACDDTPAGEDIDGDGVVNATDNCPFRGNEDQTDGDSDLKGDTCDFCPTVANLDTVCGVAPPVDHSIMEVQMGNVSAGTNVTIKDAIVVGIWANGVWVQDPSATTYAGIHVFTGPVSNVNLGDKVDATGKVLEYFGDTELDDATITVTGTGSVTPVEITVSQALEEAYEGMLVRVMDVNAVENPYDCTADNAACSDDNLWRANSALIVYDRLYKDADWASHMTPQPVAGVMMTRFDKRRIMPRTAADFAE